MTFLGKIFTFVLALLSVAFFMAALAVNATHTDLRKKVADAQARTKAAETTIDELKKGIEAKKTELDLERLARRNALSSLQTQYDTQVELLAEANKELNELNAKNTSATQQLSQLLDDVKRLQGENDSVKAEINKIMTDRNQQRRSVIKLTDELNAMRSLEGDLKVQVKQLQDQATLYQAQSEIRGAALEAAGITDPEDVPPAGLKGVILAVGSDQQVEVSVGRDDGVREGHTLEVYRSGSYLGRIQIRAVTEDKSIGKIIPAFRKGYIQAGDKVAAKIN